MRFPAFAIGAHVSRPRTEAANVRDTALFSCAAFVKIRAASDALTPPTTPVSAANLYASIEARVPQRPQGLRKMQKISSLSLPYFGGHLFEQTRTKQNMDIDRERFSNGSHYG